MGKLVSEIHKLSSLHLTLQNDHSLDILDFMCESVTANMFHFSLLNKEVQIKKSNCRKKSYILRTETSMNNIQKIFGALCPVKKEEKTVSQKHIQSWMLMTFNLASRVEFSPRKPWYRVCAITAISQLLVQCTDFKIQIKIDSNSCIRRDPLICSHMQEYT
jgi:hypothetical protein